MRGRPCIARRTARLRSSSATTRTISTPSPKRSRPSSLSAKPRPKARSSNRLLLCNSQLRKILADRVESGQEFGVSTRCEIFVLIGGATIKQGERTRLVTGDLKSPRIDDDAGRLHVVAGLQRPLVHELGQRRGVGRGCPQMVLDDIAVDVVPRLQEFAVR